MPHSSFSSRLIGWQKRHGRRNLPWQCTDPYRVWLSEIMLQQTQVATVKDYFPRFVARFPDVAALAAAEQDEVLSLWAGLGYYSRARNLHKAAGQVVAQSGGRFPQTRAGLEQLSGVGRSTAAAICAFAFMQREAILDGNVKRVLCRVFAQDGDPADKKFENRLWALAESLMPSENTDMPAYTQGLMDLGATVCRRSKPLCTACPMEDVCRANAQGLTAELPRRKAAAVKVLPLYWLVVRDGSGAVWLEKRPQGGIWGALWCVPCFEDLASLYRAAARFGLTPGDLAEQAGFTHRLTHRLLEVTPFCALAQMPSETASDGMAVDLRRLGDYGLPKPLASFLQQQRESAG